MEILIQIPPWLVEIWDAAYFRSEIFYMFLLQHVSSIWSFVTYQWNSLLLMLSMVFFWPMWVYVAVTLTTASTWIFWLIASLLLGIIQMIYVSYQFVMIATDVVILTCLKTYQVIMRSRVTQFLFFFSKTLKNKKMRISRRQCQERPSISEHSSGGTQGIRIRCCDQPKTIEKENSLLCDDENFTRGTR
jgi:hypothetical protein